MSQILSNTKLKSKEVVTYFRAWLKNSTIPATKFVIFAQARTGSTLLGDLLRSHPEIYCDGELFQDGTLLFPYRYMLGRAAKRALPVYGCQLKICQFVLIQHVEATPFLSMLHQEGWKIIYLQRTNILRQAVSELVARNRNKWEDRSKNPLKNKKVRIDSQQLLDLIEWSDNMLKKEQQSLAGIPYLPLVYETDLLSSDKHQQTLDKNFDYLNVESMPVQTRFHRTTTNHLSDFIENYQEIESLIVKTDYERFLS